MAIIRVRCPACREELEIAAAHAGQEVECGSCNHVFVARTDDRPPADDAEPDDRPRRRRRRRDDDYDDEPRDTNTVAIFALVLGVLSLPAACCCSFLAIPVQIGGIVCGVIGMQKSEGKGLAVTGLALSGVALVLTIVLLVIGVGMNLANPGQFNNGR